MTQDITNKEYIKNLIISGLEGKKINQQESKELEKAVLNFNQAEWRNFKIIGKEAFKEFIDKKIDEEPGIPSNWRGDLKNFFHSLVDFAASLASEEIIIESVRLEREKIPWEQRMRILMPLYTKQLEKIAARRPTKKIGDNAYHKAEVNLVKKVKQLKSMYEMARMAQSLGREPSKQQVLGAIKKLINLFKNLSAEEILVAKEKGKSLAAEYLTDYAPAEFRQYPELKTVANSFIKFWDAVLDEELLAEAIKLFAETAEIGLKHFDFEKLANMKTYDEGFEYGKMVGEKISQALQKGGLENRARRLLVNLTNHLNRLASEENDNNISETEEQSIIQKLSNSRQLSGTGDSTQNTGTGLTFLSPTSAFGSIRGGGSDSLSEEQFWNKLLDKYTTVESKGKWYQNPWFIGFSIVGALVVGGLIVWLLTRRKKEKITNNQHDTW